MNIVNTLTLRHIKTHKKRSILTILAIIVSVAMVTAVFTSALSFVNFFANASKAIDGSWHYYVHTDDYLGNKALFESDDIDIHGVDLFYGTADIDNNDKSYEMEINAVDKNYLDLRNVQITEGRMPESTNELLVHKKFIDKYKLGWKIGDKVTLSTLLSEDVAKQEYEIVGITESNVSETDSVSGFVFATDEFIKQAGETSVYIRYSNMDNSIFDKSEAIAKKIAINPEDLNQGYNNEYLTYSGISQEIDPTIASLVGFCAIILVIIAIVSIFMIYDSFAVSYQERARYLGMLASVGATKRQKRNSIYFEGLILGLIGIPLGILAGIGGIAITFWAISDVWLSTLGVEYNGALTVKINWIVILGTVIASALTIFVSSYIPAVKASRTTAIDAIRQSNTVKVKNSKRLKTSKLATKLLGFEGAMAVKNYKRNGRRSRTIVFALFMSVVVFVSVSNFSMMFSDAMNMTFVETSDLSVTVPIKEANELDEILDSNKNVDDYFATCYVYADIDEGYYQKEKSQTTQVIIAFVDNETIDSYLNQLGKDSSKFHNKAKPMAILHNTMVTRIDDAKTVVHPFDDVQGKAFDCKVGIWDFEKQDTVFSDFSVDIGLQTTEDWKNDKFYLQNMHIPLIMISRDFAPYLLASDVDGYTAEITCEDSALVEEQVWSALEDRNIEGSIYDASSQMQSMNSILTIVDVFVFGFIALITLISIMNIINTISNSMNERRREFAMIRSVGMTPKSFKKMIYYESFRYGFISLLWSIPVSVGIHFAMYKALQESFDTGFILHPLIYLIAIVAVFLIIGIAIIYSTTKIKDDNIIETLKMDIN